MQPGYIDCLPQLWLLLLEPCAQPRELCASGWLSACALQPCPSAAGSLAGHVLAAPWQLLQHLLLLTCPWELPQPAVQCISVTADRVRDQNQSSYSRKAISSQPTLCLQPCNTNGVVCGQQHLLQLYCARYLRHF